jgi:hypothetical protein
MAVQYVTDEIGKTTAVVVPIDEWDALIKKLYQIEPPREDTDYFLKSEKMKKKVA